MSFGTFTYGSIATLTDYRTQLTAARKFRSESVSLETKETKTVSEETPKADRMAKAMEWAGLGEQNSRSGDADLLLSSAAAAKPWAYSYSYKEPNLDLAYNFATLQQVFSYRDSVLARYEDKVPSEGDDLPAE